MKRIMIYAYTSFNLGDDLFIRELCHRYPHIQFYLYCSPKYKKNFNKIENLYIIQNTNIIYRGTSFILRKLKIDLTVEDILAKRKDAIIYIGGSIFMQHGNWKRKLNRLENVVNAKIPFFVTGANFGPYDDKKFYIKYRNFFSKIQGVSFRDQYSYDLFKDLSNVKLADDVIFQMDVDKTQAEVKDDNVLISVIKPSIRKHLKKQDNLYYEKIKDISVYYAKKGYKVTLMSFCEREGDIEAVNSIKKLIPEKFMNKIDEHLYKHDIDAALDAIAKSKYVIATRFHAMVLGWVYNKPVFPIAYSEKMTNVIKDIGFNGSYTDFGRLEELDAKLVFEGMETNTIDISEQRVNAEKQFSILDEYLKKR